MNELMEQIKIKEDLERKEALKIQKHKKMVFGSTFILYKSGNYDFTWKSCAGRFRWNCV